MNLDRLDRRGLRMLEAALRQGEPVRLRDGLRPAPPVALDELLPLLHAVEPALAAAFAAAVPAARPGPPVSVVVPTSRAVPLGLGVLRRQSVPVEVIVLVNGPRADALTGALVNRDVRVVRTPWLGHGPTRDLGVRLARHPYVFLTVNDALPLGAGFLARLVETLESGGFDAVSARQLPWPTSDPVTRARLRAWTPPGPGPAPLDNVGALYRRDALLADPFGPVPIAEDAAWGARHRTGYAPDAPLVHAHPRRFWPLYQRNRAIHAELVRRGAPPPVPDLPRLLRALPGTLGRDLPGALGELLGQWRASAAAREALR